MVYGYYYGVGITAGKTPCRQDATSGDGRGDSGRLDYS
jgi:hypothetical protein